MTSLSPLVHLTTLGCAKNQVDSDKVLAALGAAGYRDACSAEEADVVMVNTCAFVEEARRESIDTILELAELKRSDAKLVVLGCMAQRYETELVGSLPEADAVVGLDRYPELIGQLDELTMWQPIRIRSANTSKMDILHDVERPTPATPFAYVKVAEGCDKLCTFCAIPLFRGKQRSRSPVGIRAEVESLVSKGVSEVVLVAQDLGAYGRDIEAPGDITDLLRFLSDIPDLVRLRLFYLYPREVRPALIAAIAENPIVADYFDLSLQHVARHLLKAMKRPGDGDRHRDLISEIRVISPHAALRSSFIVGFPGESESDVDDLASFLEDVELDWAGFFPFSPEEGTAAVELEGQIPDREKKERLRYLQTIQDEITNRRNLEQRGKIIDVLVDQVEDGTSVARSYRQAPEIDGVVLLDQGATGEWLSARVTGAYGVDLVAEVLGPA